MKKLLFAAAILCTLPTFKSGLVAHSGLIETPYICPDCGEWGCIYEDIDNAALIGTDQDYENAIQTVCKERGIKDSATIELLRKNYYL